MFLQASKAAPVENVLTRLFADLQASGATRLKNVMLRKLGYLVVNLPFWHWNAAQAQGGQAKVECLRGLLERVREEGGHPTPQGIF